MFTTEGCSKSELELFVIPPHNVSMERGDYAIHKPLAQISHSTPLEFHVQASPDEYIDLGRTKVTADSANCQKVRRQARSGCKSDHG